MSPLRVLGAIGAEITEDTKHAVESAMENPQNPILKAVQKNDVKLLQMVRSLDKIEDNTTDILKRIKRIETGILSTSGGRSPGNGFLGNALQLGAMYLGGKTLLRSAGRMIFGGGTRATATSARGTAGAVAKNPTVLKFLTRAKALAKVSKVLGPVLIVIVEAVEPLLAIAQGAPAEVVQKEIIGAIGGIVGTVGLGAIGATFGTAILPVGGTIIGGAAGAILGSFGGEYIAERIFVYIMTTDIGQAAADIKGATSASLTGTIPQIPRQTQARAHSQGHRVVQQATRQNAVRGKPFRPRVGTGGSVGASASSQYPHISNVGANRIFTGVESTFGSYLTPQISTGTLYPNSELGRFASTFSGNVTAFDPSLGPGTGHYDGYSGGVTYTPSTDPGAYVTAGPGPTNVRPGTEGLEGRNALIKATYDAFIQSGFSHDQAMALTAEVGREGSFKPENMFGVHIDPYNKTSNLGILSMQGSRKTALLEHLRKTGRIDENGQIIRDQTTLNEMANFIRNEMQTNYNTPGVQEFLATDTIDPERAARILGKEYIRWKIDDPRYSASGNRNRRDFYNIAKAVVSQFADGGTPETTQRVTASPDNDGKVGEVPNRIEMNNQRAIRNRAISPELQEILNYAAVEAGVDKVSVISGGQISVRDGGIPGRTRRGSPRHDDHGHGGGAADIDLYVDGKRVDDTTPEGRKILADFARASARAGATGLGHARDYMGSGRMHIGFGDEATWGRKGGRPSPWIVEAHRQGRSERASFRESGGIRAWAAQKFPVIAPEQTTPENDSVQIASADDNLPTIGAIPESPTTVDPSEPPTTVDPSLSSMVSPWKNLYTRDSGVWMTPATEAGLDPEGLPNNHGFYGKIASYFKSDGSDRMENWKTQDGKRLQTLTGSYTTDRILGTLKFVSDAVYGGWGDTFNLATAKITPIQTNRGLADIAGDRQDDIESQVSSTGEIGQPTPTPQGQEPGSSGHAPVEPSVEKTAVQTSSPDKTTLADRKAWRHGRRITGAN